MVNTPRVRAELMAQAPQGLTPGATVWLGLQLSHQPQWHSYWKNAGDSGLPTELRWTLPQGLDVGEIDWPAPHRIPLGTLANYGYEGTVLLPVPLRVAQTFVPPLAVAGAIGAATVPIQLSATWLVCRTECIPEQGQFTLQLPVQGSTALNGKLFAAALTARPQTIDTLGSARIESDALQLRVAGLPASVRGQRLAWYPETSEVIRNAATSAPNAQQGWEGETWTARLPLAEHRSASPTHMHWVLALEGPARASAEAKAQTFAWRVQTPVSGSWPATAVAAPAPNAPLAPALEAALAQNQASARAQTGGPALAPLGTVALLATLAAALLGGLLLNLMPCVFPVLAIKVLGLTRHAHDRKAHRQAAWAYSGGVLISVLALGATLLALRASGAQWGWGFQLQSPAMVAGLAALFTLIGLNLAGVFEFGHFAPQAWASAQARHPLVNDFFSGVLAVLVASPCTAPFMGASLGLAIGLPAAQALTIFGALGLGLALPYLALGLVPALARWLPRPGPWMNTLQRLLAFPMFAVVVWLVWVLGQQSGIDGAGALLALLLTGAGALWALELQGRTRWILATFFIASFVLLISAIGSFVIKIPAQASAQSAVGEDWQAWSPERVAQLHAQGRPVFVDFTAAWCLSCQLNKKTTLTDAAVLADFRARKVALLRADWTGRNPAISAALTALGRSGVPVYLLHAPGRAPQLLGEILSPAEVRSALAALP